MSKKKKALQYLRHLIQLLAFLVSPGLFILILSFAILTFGIVITMICLVYRIRGRRSFPLWYLSIGVLCGAVWLLLDNYTYPLFFQNYFVDGIAEYLVLMLLPKDGDKIMFNITLKNNGKYDQYDVPQVYVRRVDSKVEWPYKELKAFGKYKVPAGLSLNEGLIIPVEDLKYWDETKHDWVLEPGKIELLLARNAGEIIAKLELEIR